MEWKTRSYQENCDIVNEYLNTPGIETEKEISLRIMRGETESRIRNDMKMSRRQWRGIKHRIAEGLLKAERHLHARNAKTEISAEAE